MIHILFLLSFFISSAFSETIVFSNYSKNKTILSSYDRESKNVVAQKEVEGRVLAIESFDLESLYLLIRRAKKISVVQVNLLDGTEQRIIDSTFAPLALGTNSERYILLTVIQSTQQPSLAVFDRYGAYQRVLFRAREIITSPRLNEAGDSILYTSIEPSGASIWQASFLEPESKVKISETGCIDSRFGSNENIVMLCKGQRVKNLLTEYQILSKKVRQKNIIKLWNGLSSSAPILSRDGSKIIYKDATDKTKILNLGTLQEKKLPEIFGVPLALVN